MIDLKSILLGRGQQPVQGMQQPMQPPMMDMYGQQKGLQNLLMGGRYAR